KQGRFRQNLLGKRVDYSGRSVIVSGPELELHQCGLPKVMAVELYKPYIVHELERRGLAETVKRAKKLVEEEDPVVYEVLGDVIKDHPVLLNRAPTLHRLGIQAFEPVLVEGKALRVHPLICPAFNADFDGDQMAVHVPLSFEAQMESRVLMLSSNNILKPANGQPIAAPSQDMVLGCYYVTKEGLDHDERVEEGDLHHLDDADEVALALANGRLRTGSGQPDWQQPVRFLVEPDAEDPEDRWAITTVGRVAFNAILPDGMPFVNEVMTKGTLKDLIFEVFRTVGLKETTRFLDRLKEFGFRSATEGGISIGMDDMEIPPEKSDILGDAQEDVDRFTKAYHRGVISNGERYNKVIDAWTHANNDVADAMIDGLETSRDGFNPVYIMFDSGARGSRDQIRQLAGMRGLMAKPQKELTGGIGEIIESPIRSNFREGLSVLEYFISTHGARKGLADTALKTADAGYLTRRLVDVSQDVTITADDCGTVLGLEVAALKEGEDIVEPLGDRIVGNVAQEDIVDPIDDELLVEAGELIEEDEAEAVEQSGLQSVKIRSVLTCEARRGICRQCYGRNPATLEMVNIGEAVGIIAAQSIGEPGTQLTLRTFHTGGTAARVGAQTRRKSKHDGRVGFERVDWVENPDGEKVVTSREGEILMHTSAGRVRSRLSVPYGATLHAEEGQEVDSGDLLFSWDPYSEPIVADKEGTVVYRDIVPEETLREELDESTGRRQPVIIEDKEKKLHPRLELLGGDGGKLREFIVPSGAQLMVEDQTEVEPGAVLAKISREAYKTKDITGGLPRVAELFEARDPDDPATISEVDGRVSFGGIKRGKREIFVTTDDDEEHKYKVEVGTHLRVHEGDRVRAGDRLSEGPVNPHDILRVKGPRAVQEYLLNEIQQVYRLQGVRIADKHIGVVVRQMMKKVRVTDPGDTEYLEDQQVNRMDFREKTREVMQAGGEPPRAEPLLLGITKASLNTESFISAASFQETTRVLTDATVRGAVDHLRGLKENVIIGHKIPAGTGVHDYDDIEFLVGEPLGEELDELRSAPEREGLFADLDTGGTAGDGAEAAGEEPEAEEEEVTA
ncbi:MAG: DNA-directed RNA polymerase subunit beta', partial [Gemmatimonadota bacterium]